MKLKYLTLNLWLGGKLFDNIIPFLKKENADIISFQEAFNGKDSTWPERLRSMHVLQDALHYPYTYFAPEQTEHVDEGMLERGNAIFSKYPIIKAESVFFDIPYGVIDERKMTDFTYVPRNMAVAEIDLGEKNCTVGSIHGIWGLDGRDNERRLSMSQTVVNALKDKTNVILSGDFNLQPNTKTIETIEKYFKNVFKNELTSTFNMTHKTNQGYATAVVDMMFVSREIKVFEHSMPLDDVSDHRPLVAVLEV